MIIQDLIEGLRILQEYESDLDPNIETEEGEIRVTIHQSIHVSEDDVSMLEEFGWRYSEESWVRWI